MNRRIPFLGLVFLYLFVSATSVVALHPALYPDVTGEVVDHGFFVIDYSEPAEQARWAAYLLRAEDLEEPVSRTDDFRVDPLVSTGSATLDDYYKSGFDRGHLVPARDMAFSILSMSESFVLSNMSPQEAAFNRGVWSELESLVRRMAFDEGSVFVITGPVLSKDPVRYIGPNQLPVPGFFYKVLLTPRNGAIGIVLPNTGVDAPLGMFIHPVDILEDFAEIDFFAGMTEDEQAALESGYDLAFWAQYFPLVEEALDE